MRVIHLLRKFDPAEWGGTETAVERLFDGLRQHDVTPVMFCPYVNDHETRTATTVSGDQNVRADPNRLAPTESPVGNPGDIKRFKTCVPTWGISRQEKRQFIALGGNLMSFDLLPALWREPDVALVHTHTLGRLGGIASAVARGRGLPFVVSIHGGLLDVPPALKKTFVGPSRRSLEWGKIFGLLLQSRRLIHHADAVLACNLTEAELLRKNYPGKRIIVQPHGIHTGPYQQDHRATARAAFPQICERDVLLCAGRIDPVKNQRWLIDHAPQIFRDHPKALLVLAGACTNEAYGQDLAHRIRDLGLGHRVLRTGGLPPGDPRLIGLIQESCAVLLPSISETFGLIVLEAWAAGTTVISSRTSGASALIQDGENGWLFDLSDPRSFHQAVSGALLNPGLRTRLAESGRKLVNSKYDVISVAGRVKQLYTELIEEKHALRHSA
ncbi:MAG: glycosyltransferase family 4 protein [Akkermansiaceae bacterium]|nr:glycosyltransferase family 4 protein [Verrucomicrobiales bacterium]